MELLHEIPLDEVEELEGMARRCHEIHAIPPTYGTLELEVAEQESGIVTARYADLTRSFTRQYYDMITSTGLGVACGVNGGTTQADGSLACKDTNGTMRYYTNYINGMSGNPGNNDYSCEQGTGYCFRAAAASVAIGIVLGRGTNAEAFNDYALQTPCAEGTSTNQFNYTAMAVPTATWDAGTRKWKYAVVRIINNNSVASIGVNEVALYAYFLNGANAACVTRDHLDAQVDCAAGSQVTATYNLFSPAFPS